MQALKARLTSLGVLVAVALIGQGCGWKRTMRFPSPSGRSAIEVWQTQFANELGTRIRLVTPDRSVFVFENRREAHVYFVHVYWSEDETRAGVIATGANIWQVALDAVTGKQIPFGQIRESFAASLRKTYEVPTGEDPIEWAASADAQNQFFRRHSDIKLSYR